MNLLKYVIQLNPLCKLGIIDEIGNNHVRTCYHKDKSKRMIFFGRMSHYWDVKFNNSKHWKFLFITVIKIN